jgi:hypothetical protein
MNVNGFVGWKMSDIYQEEIAEETEEPAEEGIFVMEEFNLIRENESVNPSWNSVQFGD